MLAIQFEPPKTQDVWSQSVLYMEAYNLKKIFIISKYFFLAVSNRLFIQVNCGWITDNTVTYTTDNILIVKLCLND